MEVRTVHDYEGRMDSRPPTQPICERCGKPELQYVAAVPKSPNNTRDQHVFNCSACAHVQWIAQPLRSAGT